jgi:hypothetical protein
VKQNGQGGSVVGVWARVLRVLTVVCCLSVVTAVEALPTSGSSATVPGRPTGLGLTPGVDEVTLNWTAPVSDGGSPVFDYEIYQVGRASNIFIPAQTNYTITGLKDNTSYSFRVSAVNVVGAGAPSTAASATTASVPGRPTGLGVAAGVDDVTLNWTAPVSDGGSSLSGYEIYQAGQTANIFIPVQTNYTITGLKDNTSYTFRVGAVNVVGAGAPSTAASATTASVPGLTTGLGAAPGVDEVTLSWTAPVSDGGSSLSGYEIYQRHRAASIFVPAGQTNYTITGLKDNTSYSFRVSAVNVVGAGAPSTAASATTASVPGRPTGLVAAAGVDDVTLNWTAPVSDGGSSLSGYEIYQAGQAANIFIPVQTNYTITGLKDNTSYSFRVAAVNVVGAGPYSTAASATTASATTTTTG